MWNRTQAGMTLVELIIAMVILAVGVGGVLVVYNNTTRNSTDPVLQKQMVAIAEGMMEEIQRMPFAASANAAPAQACGRDTYNDLADYNNYASTDACDVLGNIQVADYAVAVAVVPDGTFAPAGATMRITVTVTRGNLSVNLVGWRTNYALQIP